MKLLNDQYQSGGDGGVNAQAGRDVIIHGVTYTEAKQIALDVYRANALALQGEAVRIASERAEHLVDEFLQKMQQGGAQQFQEARNPDFQYAMFEAQKTFARSGDQNVETVLVNLLAARASEPEQNLRQVVLNEAITAMARLTSAQIELVTLIFVLRHTKNTNINRLDDLRAHVARLEPLAACIPNGDAVYSYLVYSGIATEQVGSISLPGIFRSEYPGVFAKGYGEDVFAKILEREPSAQQIVIPCLNDPAKKQVSALDKRVLDERCAELGLSDQTKKELHDLLTQNLMDEAEIESWFAMLGEPVQRIFTGWKSHALQRCALTSVGIAIGHANAVRMGAINADLGIWIN